jgi:septal ring factor EnvC (AmiA/AmiB activator)
MGNVKKQSERISALEKQISEAKARETQFEEAIENLNGDLRNAESEVGKWRKAAKEGKVGIPNPNERNESFSGPRVEEVRLGEQVRSMNDMMLILGRDVAECATVSTAREFEDPAT